MDSVNRLFSLLFEFTLAVSGLFFLIKLLQFHSNHKAKNELQRIQARISILRMNLKAKVKKRAHAFRQYFSKSIAPNEIIDRDLNDALEIKFDTGSDFQEYFESIQKLHALIEAVHKDPESPVETYFEFDSKNELIILLIVKEMRDASTNYNEKISIYNRANPKHKLPSVDPIEFKSLADIEHALSQHEKLELSEAEKLDVA